jgi:hypothetical protein
MSVEISADSDNLRRRGATGKQKSNGSLNAGNGHASHEDGDLFNKYDKHGGKSKQVTFDEIEDKEEGWWVELPVSLI